MSGWNLKKKYWLSIALFVLVYTLFLGLLAAYLWTEMEQGVQEQIKALLADNFGAIFLVGLCFFMGQLFMVNEIFQHYIVPLYNLEEETTLIARVNPGHRVQIKGCQEIQDIAASVNSLAEQLEAVRDRAHKNLREQYFRLEKEKDFYLGILNDLPLGIISCSEAGEIVAYNKMASSMFASATKEHGSYPACSFLGLKKEIHELLNPGLINIILQKLRDSIVFSSAQKALGFTCSNQEDRLLYMQMVPLWREQIFLGYTLLCYEIDQQIELNPGQERFNLIWPKQLVGLQEIVAMVTEKQGLGLTAEKIGDGYNIRADIFLLQRLLSFLLHRCEELCAPQTYYYGIVNKQDALYLEIRLPGVRADHELVEFWKGSPLVGFDAQNTALFVQDVLQLHQIGLEMQEIENGSAAVLRLKFPLLYLDIKESPWDILPRDGLQFARLQILDQGPAAYDELDKDLEELSYTVFDTETTGMNPKAGDEIVSISAVRIVNGRLQLQEIFNQLVNPQRPIPFESIRIHGIRPEMVEGQPIITEVLPIFQKFAQGTVLLGHNAFFDMQFLNRKKDLAQVKLDNTVLDTALLSALVMPQHKDQSLEAVAKMLGVRIHARHTSLGDAMTAAEIFLALLPLLKHKGLKSLRQVCRAVQRVSLDTGQGRRGF